MKNTILLTLLFICQLFAQPDFIVDRDIIQSGKYFNSEIHFFPSSQGYSVYYSYKISYSQLFFQKQDDNFNAGFNVRIEIKDSSGNIIERVYDEKNVSVKDFDITNSKDTFLQGVLSLKLSEGKYSCSAVISDQTSKRERRIPPVDIIIKKDMPVLTPIIFEPEKIFCDRLESYILTNYSLSIPFNKPTNDLAVPVTDKNINSLTINVKRGDTVFYSDKKVVDSFLGNPEIKNCDQKVVITQSVDTANVKIFIVKDFSSKLTEGPVLLEIYPDDNLSKKQVFNLYVVWTGKPFSLTDSEQAIKILEIIESKDVVSGILKGNGTDTENLYNYWKKHDPTPDTEYNELMNEFYTRVDYCELHFKSLAGNNGARSDRGKIYIKFGPPDSIERDTNKDDKIVESWFYEEFNRKFVFVDINGTGKFNLAN